MLIISFFFLILHRYMYRWNCVVGVESARPGKQQRKNKGRQTLPLQTQNKKMIAIPTVGAGSARPEKYKFVLNN